MLPGYYLPWESKGSIKVVALYTECINFVLISCSKISYYTRDGSKLESLYFHVLYLEKLLLTLSLTLVMQFFLQRKTNSTNNHKDKNLRQRNTN